MQNLQVIELKGQRVLTTRQLASAYETDVKVIQNNFSRNKERYVAGKYYIYMDRDELREVKTTYPQFEGELKRTSRAHFWTEKGALLHAKSVNTDKAWEVYDYRVDFYFRAKEQLQITQTKPEPVKKPSGRKVVDIPENAEIQAAIQEVHKQLVAMDSVLKAYNRYQCKENYLHLESTLELLWHETGRKIINLMDIEPNLVVK